MNCPALSDASSSASTSARRAVSVLQSFSSVATRSAAGTSMSASNSSVTWRQRSAVIASAMQLPVQPRSGANPVAVHGSWRDAEDLCRLGVGQSAEEAALDESAQAWVDGLESIERVADGEDLVGAVLDRDRCFIEADAPQRAAALRGQVASGVVDEHAAHGVGGDAHHARRVLPLDFGLFCEAQIGFVDEARGVEGVPGSLVTELPAREPAELLIDAREDLVEVGSGRLRARIRARFGLRHHRRSAV